VKLSRSIIIDTLLATAVVVLSVVTVYALAATHVSRVVLFVSLGGLVAVAIMLVTARIATRPDHEQALHSHMILEVANASLAYLRTGLTEESAQAVCRIALAESEAAAVAITDTERVLGFAGIGEDHHEVGGPIITRATHEALETNEHRILSSPEEIGCPQKTCLLRAAIVVPMEMRGIAAGTLKFYYTTPRLLNETQIAMASGLAQLLSTQLELAELDRQTELATRMELKALQAQINPHFLFNTINTIASLIRTDPPRARELLREFATFYRRTLESEDDLIPLERELEYVRSYFRFEHARFGDRVELDERVAPELLAEMVPAFIIQPLVENAIQHGMRASELLHIGLDSDAAADRVVITVCDNGVGMSAESVERAMEPGFGTGLGIALKNVDDRLKGHFGPGSGVRIESQEGEGTRVSLILMRSTVAA
jgi:two-component system sensor histidine kinase LytS